MKNVCKDRAYFSRNIHLKVIPCEPGRLQRENPAAERAVKTCAGVTLMEGSISLIASRTSWVVKKWVPCAGVDAG